MSEAITLKKGPHTGIYQTVSYHADTPEGIRDLLQRIADQGRIVQENRSDFLDDIEQAAKETSQREKSPPGFFNQGDPADHQWGEFRKVVAAAWGCCEQIRYHAEAGDTMEAIVEAIQLGRILEQCAIRQHHEYNAGLGGRASAVQRKRGAKRHGTLAERQAKYDAYQRDVDALRASNPTLSYSEACRRAATKSGAHFNTVVRHTTNRTSKSKE